MTYRKIQQENVSQRLIGEMYMPSRSRVFNLLDRLQGNREETRPIPQTEMANLARLCTRTIIRSLNELVADGQVIVYPQWGWVDGEYLRTANVYKIVKKSLKTLLELLKLKQIRDNMRHAMVARLRKKTLSDKAVTAYSESQKIENKEPAAMPLFVVSERLLRSKMVSG